MCASFKRGAAILHNDLRRIQSSPSEHFSVGCADDIYNWEVVIIGPQGTPYENGIFKAIMKFPMSYPDDPPTFTFKSNMFHPNIHPTTYEVCISILHKSGDDAFGYESANERWLPVRNPESVIISILSLLSAPNVDSPADLDAANMYVRHRDDYEKLVRKIAQKTLESE
ncbi:hypothetical protein EDEG_03142 [Edhazardia aedis USNM 41457]|uniref:UBC core domain-containing protein n=1 Tax=Edhazardia aedis (strain USNM 41457) TaxID=1003232 RepID=J8ZRW5_EDHAE|nr:hypothetical protein EDEG_03142 [Edhazardia aedis USNM 41457]|eukprot:EJW02438.1 hypothetical protein EDEG_03142 [Edhazardia aedis USNM 41457]